MAGLGLPRPQSRGPETLFSGIGEPRISARAHGFMAGQRQPAVFAQLPLPSARIRLGPEPSITEVRAALDRYFVELSEAFSPPVAATVRAVYAGVIDRPLSKRGIVAGGMVVRATQSEDALASYVEMPGRHGVPVFELEIASWLTSSPIAVRLGLIHELLHIAHKLERIQQVGPGGYQLDWESVHRFTEFTAAWLDKALVDRLPADLYEADVAIDAFDRAAVVKELQAEHEWRRKGSPSAYLAEMGKKQIQSGNGPSGKVWCRDADVEMFRRRLAGR